MTNTEKKQYQQLQVFVFYLQYPQWPLEKEIQRDEALAEASKIAAQLGIETAQQDEKIWLAQLASRLNQVLLDEFQPTALPPRLTEMVAVYEKSQEKIQKRNFDYIFGQLEKRTKTQAWIIQVQMAQEIEKQLVSLAPHNPALPKAVSWEEGLAIVRALPAVRVRESFQDPEILGTYRQTVSQNTALALNRAGLVPDGDGRVNQLSQNIFNETLDEADRLATFPRQTEDVRAVLREAKKAVAAGFTTTKEAKLAAAQQAWQKATVTAAAPYVASVGVPAHLKEKVAKSAGKIIEEEIMDRLSKLRQAELAEADFKSILNQNRWRIKNYLASQGVKINDRELEKAFESVARNKIPAYNLRQELAWVPETKTRKDPAFPAYWFQLPMVLNRLRFEVLDFGKGTAEERLKEAVEVSEKTVEVNQASLLNLSKEIEDLKLDVRRRKLAKNDPRFQNIRKRISSLESEFTTSYLKLLEVQKEYGQRQTQMEVLQGLTAERIQEGIVVLRQNQAPAEVIATLEKKLPAILAVQKKAIADQTPLPTGEIQQLKNELVAAGVATESPLVRFLDQKTTEAYQAENIRLEAKDAQALQTRLAQADLSDRPELQAVQDQLAQAPSPGMALVEASVLQSAIANLEKEGLLPSTAAKRIRSQIEAARQTKYVRLGSKEAKALQTKLSSIDISSRPQLQALLQALQQPSAQAPSPDMALVEVGILNSAFADLEKEALLPPAAAQSIRSQISASQDSSQFHASLTNQEYREFSRGLREKAILVPPVMAGWEQQLWQDQPFAELAKRHQALGEPLGFDIPPYVKELGSRLPQAIKKRLPTSFQKAWTNLGLKVGFLEKVETAQGMVIQSRWTGSVVRFFTRGRYQSVTHIVRTVYQKTAGRITAAIGRSQLFRNLATRWGTKIGLKLGRKGLTQVAAKGLAGILKAISAADPEPITRVITFLIGLAIDAALFVWDKIKGKLKGLINNPLASLGLVGAAAAIPMIIPGAIGLAIGGTVGIIGVGGLVGYGAGTLGTATATAGTAVTAFFTAFLTAPAGIGVSILVISILSLIGVATYFVVITTAAAYIIPTVPIASAPPDSGPGPGPWPGPGPSPTPGPDPGPGPGQNQYFTVTKTANPSQVDSIPSGEKIKVTYTVEINADQEIYITVIIDKINRLSCEGERPYLKSLIITPAEGDRQGTSWTIVFTREYDDQFNNCIICNTVTVRANIPSLSLSGLEATASACVEIGEAPADCPEGWPMVHGEIHQGPHGAFSHQIPYLQEAVDIGGNRVGTGVFATFDGEVVNNNGIDKYGLQYVQVEGQCDSDGDGTPEDFYAWFYHLRNVEVSLGGISQGTKIGEIGFSADPEFKGRHLHYEFTGVSVDNGSLFMGYPWIGYEGRPTQDEIYNCCAYLVHNPVCLKACEYSW